MKKTLLLLLTLFFCVTLTAGSLYATDASTEFKRLAAEVSTLELGFGDYTLGAALNAEQVQTAEKHRIEKSLPGSYKFQDGETFVVAKADDNTVIGIYKEYPNVTPQQVKAIVGGLMMRFDEPTTVGHDKLIYWAFDKNGRISDEVYSMLKKGSGADVLGLVKFSSSVSISGISKKKPEKVKDEKAEKEPSAYVIVSSDPLSKLFLAMNR